MKSWILFSLLVILNTALGGEALYLKTVRSGEHTYIYQAEFSESICEKRFSNSCSLFLEGVHDSYRITLNKTVLIDESTTYLGFEPVLVQIPKNLVERKNNIKIEVFNLKGGGKVGVAGQVIVDSLSKNRIRTYLARLKVTGTTLGSIHVLLIFILLLISISFHGVDKYLISILAYAFISCFYLLSFSEIPRYFFNPEILSGAVHFPLRLVQDVSLFSLFHIFLGNGRSKIFIFCLGSYAVAIGLMILPALFGHVAYDYHAFIIKVFAPLVALPMGYAVFLSLNIENPRERQILIWSSLILFVFQVNDLMVFWQIYSGVFTVKFYIPLVMSVLIYIYMARKIKEYQERRDLALRSKVAMQVAHDIRSPVAVLNCLAEKLESDDIASKRLMEASLGRINSIAESILPSAAQKESFDMKELITGIINHKEFEFPNAELTVEGTGFLVTAVKLDFERVISNLINNSVEAGGLSPKINILLRKDRGYGIIEVRDNGGGIPKQVLSNVGKFGNTFGKNKGNGLGLSYMGEVVNGTSGFYKIANTASGASVKMNVPLTYH